MTLPCTPWISEADLADCNLCSVGDLAVGQADQIIDAATEVLYLLTGQQFPGQCVDTVRPCNCGCGPVSGNWAGPWPVRNGSVWVNACGCGATYCGSGGAAILLPNRPVISVTSVLIDGAAYTDFRLDSPGWLVRTDGSTWPTCQDITRDTTETNTWQVSYLWGKVPPASAVYAVTIFASELVKACLGDSSCRIPAGAVTVNRRGVSYDLQVTDGKTGLYEVDQVISALNPGARRRRARAYSPDDVRFVRSTSGS